MKIKVMEEYEESSYRDDFLSSIKEMIEGKLSVFPHLDDGKISITVSERKIIWKKNSDVESGKYQSFCPNMEKRIIEKLQGIIDEKNERHEQEKCKFVLDKRVENIEKLLIETLKRFGV